VISHRRFVAAEILHAKPRDSSVVTKSGPGNNDRYCGFYDLKYFTEKIVEKRKF